MKNMAWGDQESIRNFKRSGDLLKWLYSSGAMNLSVVVFYSIFDSIINASSSIKSVWCY